MYDLHFGRDRPPFRDENGRDPRTDPVLLSAVRRALKRGVANANLPKWLKDHRQYLHNMYNFSSAVEEGYSLDYVWVALLGYLLACERATEGDAAFFVPHLPFPLVDPSGRLDEESALVLHTATFAHALFYPMADNARRLSVVAAQADSLMVAATTILARLHPVQEYAQPSLMEKTPELRQMVLEADRPLRRWFVNVAHMSTAYVVENATIHTVLIHQSRGRRRRRR
jgi:hypothetical protein